MTKSRHLAAHNNRSMHALLLAQSRQVMVWAISLGNNEVQLTKEHGRHLPIWDSTWSSKDTRKLSQHSPPFE